MQRLHDAKTFPAFAAMLTLTGALVLAGCGEPARSSTAPVPSAAPPASAGSASVSATTPNVAQATSPGATTPQRSPSPNASGQIAVMQVAAMVEGCFGARPDYRLCTRPTSVTEDRLPPLVDREPGPGEARVIADGPTSYAVEAVDADGTRWRIRRPASGAVERTCTTVSGTACGASAFTSG